MEQYYQSFSRQQSNNRVISNDQFYNSRNSQPRRLDDINRTEADLVERIERPQPKKLEAISPLQGDYVPAKYSKALLYKKERSYFLKNERGQYRELDLLENTDKLKYFGLGPYFYVEFMRRICWLYLILSLLEGVRIYINAKSGGLSGYSISFSTYLISTTLGNYSYNVISKYDPYIMAIVPAVVLLAFVLFYICWKCHFSGQIDDAEENMHNIKPEKFCLEIQTDNEGINMTEKDLRTVFESFGPIYEISIIRNYRDKLHYFESLQSLEESIKQLELEIKLQGGNPQDLTSLKKERDSLLNEIREMKINPKTISAYIHYEYEKSKIECLTYFNKHYLFNTCTHGTVRGCCCCCIDDPKEKFKLENKYKLLVKNQEVPNPEDINWQSFELSCCGRFCRFLFAAFIIIIFLAFSCTVIGICTIYVSNKSSNCDSVTIATSLSAAQLLTDQKSKTCYCNANLLSSLTDSGIKSYCSSELESIYIEQGVQYAIIAISALTNFLFGLVVDRIIDCTRPVSQSASLKLKTLILTIFLIFNTIFLPILLYSDIFGFKASSYFSFVTLISTDISNFLQVDSLQFYLDYSPIWFRNVSPIFTNYLIFDTLFVWLSFIMSKYRSNYEGLQSYEGKMLQKHMNQQIISFQFSPYKQYSAFLMIIFMSTFLSAGMPVLLPLAMFDLFSRYITNRSLLQHSSTRVDGLGITFSQLPHNLLPFLLVIAGVNAAWFLTANSSLYPSVFSFTLNLGSISSWSVLTRELYLPFYIFLSILVAIQYILYHIFKFCCGVLCNCYEKKQAIHPSHAKPFSDHKKSMNILTSFNIRSNDKMRNAVTRMEFYLQRE